MDPIFSSIAKILQRDSKSTTYKFALLRGTIDIIQDNSPYIHIMGDRVHFPLGLLIEKWMVYYYPILDSEVKIPQIHGEGICLSFSREFLKIIEAYKAKGGLSAFYNDLKNKGIPKASSRDFYDLARKIRETITRMPMKYIGRSISNNYYSIFSFDCPRERKQPEIDLRLMIETFGTFSIPIEYFEAFKTLGSFINGQDALLFKWAEFSVNASGKKLSINRVINEVLRSPIIERDILESKKLYSAMLKEKGHVHCVWSGKLLSSYDIDHVVPFSIWKNNDLWNLLPAHSSLNNQKRDKVPAPEVIYQRREAILSYWDLISEYANVRFEKEIKITLLGRSPATQWRETAIDQLMSTCKYLTNERGYERWVPQGLRF